MGCCDSSTQFGRDGGIFRAGAGVAEGDASCRQGDGVDSNFPRMATSEQLALQGLKPPFFLRLSVRRKPRPTKIDIGDAAAAGTGDAEVESARRQGAGVKIAVDNFKEGASAAKAATHNESLIVKHVENSAAGRDAMNVCDNRIMDSPAAAQGSVARWLLLLLVRFYQIFFSPFLGGACKFYPSCSRYAQEAIATHGARRGAWLALKRLLRCRPFTKGGFDPVPEPDVANRVGARATAYPTLEYSDANWLRTASKERAQ
jgi:putative membrane protein insertion efficiency factor